MSCEFKTYQLHISVRKKIRLRIGKLGDFSFPPGRYVYTGSARKNLHARIQRHKAQEKKLKWHVDYLLSSPHVSLNQVTLSSLGECQLNQSTPGNIPIKGFGSSDCRGGCGAHLKLVCVDCESNMQNHESFLP